MDGVIHSSNNQDLIHWKLTLSYKKVKAVETEQNPKDLEKYYIPYGLLFFRPVGVTKIRLSSISGFKRVSEMVLIDFC